MRAAIDPSLYATDIAIEQALAGVPFRDAYRRAAEAADQRDGRTPEKSLQARTSPGAAADLRLDELHERLRSLRDAKQ
jgi:argininosuccinate lyase